MGLGLGWRTPAAAEVGKGGWCGGRGRSAKTWHDGHAGGRVLARDMPSDFGVERAQSLAVFCWEIVSNGAAAWRAAVAAALVHLPLLAACHAVHPDGGGVQGAAVCAAIYMCEHAAEGCRYPSDTCVTTLRVVAGMAVLSLAHLLHGVPSV